jgi:large subunit ribosomal protein L9|tara:strand:+ start:977 stop:1705 length:729 start_codon:yes stop_codon:yes gene_type:complete
MEVILLESLNKLGKIGDLVNVKDGYARNYLIPQKKALRANDQNKDYFAKIKKDLVEKNNKVVEDAKLSIKKILSNEVIFVRNASDNGQLYGSVSPKDVANFFIEKNIDVKPSNVNFHNAIKKVGIYDINIKLHPEVGCNIKINVSTSIENAELQKIENEKPKEKLQEKKNIESEKNTSSGKVLKDKQKSDTKAEDDEQKLESQNVQPKTESDLDPPTTSQTNEDSDPNSKNLLKKTAEEKDK